MTFSTGFFLILILLVLPLSLMTFGFWPTVAGIIGFGFLKTLG